MGLLTKPKRHKLVDLIGSTSKAISDSYAHTTKSALEYIDESLENKNPKTLDFSIGGKDFHFPIISLYPPPALTVKKATVTIKTSIVDIENGEIITEEHDATFAISKVPCNAASNTAQCTELSISDVLFREAMYDEPFLIEAIDMKRKPTTHYMNEGLLITGDSLNDPPITELSKKMSSQSGFIVYELTRTDKINNIWTDQFGYTWSEANPGNWFYVDGPKPIVSSACTNTNNRYCDVFADKIKWHTDNMEKMRDSIYGDIYTIAEFDDLDDPVTLIETPGNSRTQFLEDNGMSWVRTG